MTYLPLTLTDEGVDTVADTATATDLQDHHEEMEVVPVVDDEELNRFHLAPELAESITQGDWEGRLQMTFDERERAERVRDVLVSGSA